MKQDVIFVPLVCNCVSQSSTFILTNLLFLIQVWSTLIMQRRYNGKDYLFAVLVTAGCTLFILYPVISELKN